MFKLYDFMTCFLSGSGILFRCEYDKGIWFLCMLFFEQAHEFSNRIVVVCLKNDFMHNALFVCLFLLLYVPCQQLWSLRDGQFT